MNNARLSLRRNQVPKVHTTNMIIMHCKQLRLLQHNTHVTIVRWQKIYSSCKTTILKRVMVLPYIMTVHRKQRHIQQLREKTIRAQILAPCNRSRLKRVTPRTVRRTPQPPQSKPGTRFQPSAGPRCTHQQDPPLGGCQTGACLHRGGHDGRQQRFLVRVEGHVAFSLVSRPRDGETRGGTGGAGGAK